MSIRAAPLCAILSDWEVVEAYGRMRRGSARSALAAWYGVSDRTLARAFERLEEKARQRGIAKW